MTSRTPDPDFQKSVLEGMDKLKKELTSLKRDVTSVKKAIASLTDRNAEVDIMGFQRQLDVFGADSKTLKDELLQTQRDICQAELRVATNDLVGWFKDRPRTDPQQEKAALDVLQFIHRRHARVKALLDTSNNPKSLFIKEYADGVRKHLEDNGFYPYIKE